MRITRQILGLAAVASMFGIAPQLQAQKIDFSGFALGCFYTTTVCDPLTFGGSDTFLSSSGGGKVEYTLDGFSGTTTGVGDNDIGFGGACVTGSCGGFGTFFVNAGSGPGTEWHPPLANNLKLLIGFYFNDAILCPGCVPTVSPFPTISVATVKGDISVTDNGTIKVRFGPDVPFSFVNGGTAGTCNAPAPICVGGTRTGTGLIHVNGVDLGAGQSIKINGNISVEVDPIIGTPEPATFALFATGLVGLVPVVRYRRRKSA